MSVYANSAGITAILSSPPSFSLTYRQLIYNYPEQLFADAGVMAIEHADFEGIERLSLVLGQQHAHTSINLPLLQMTMQVMSLCQLPLSHCTE